MAAPSIPHLSAFRSSGGRGRGRGKFPGENSSSSPSLQEQSTSRDKIVQQTDQDASVSRLSAVRVGYLEDPFAALFAPNDIQIRFPIINRGTYVRTQSIDALVGQFLSTPSKTKKQIISLGAGSDTRIFRLLQKDPSLRASLSYHEIDFPKNAEQKLAVISKSAELQELILPSKSEGPFYSLHSLDLRTLNSSLPPPPTLETIDGKLPTLVLSECCLVYLDPSLADQAAKFFTQGIMKPETPIGMVLYEPIRPNDAFGKVMVSNLAARGIELQTLRRYGSLEAQAARMKSYGFEKSQGMTIKDMWDVSFDEVEKARIAELEMVDEVEEWELLADHYCVVWAWKGAGDGIWEGWRRANTPPV